MLTCFEILRTQMGIELINTILQTTFSVFNMLVFYTIKNQRINFTKKFHLVKTFEMSFANQNQQLTQRFQGKKFVWLDVIFNCMFSSRFLEFLILLVNEPGNNKLAQKFLPTIIELCTTALYPAIREVICPFICYYLSCGF